MVEALVDPVSPLLLNVLVRVQIIAGLLARQLTGVGKVL